VVAMQLLMLQALSAAAAVPAAPAALLLLACCRILTGTDLTPVTWLKLATAQSSSSATSVEFV
jgi:hypothetical protein